MASLQTDNDGGVTVVKLTGSLNQQGVEAVEPPFAQATGLSQRMVIDLSRVDVVNTPAIAMFLGAHRAAHRAGGRVIFTGIQGMVEDTLRRCRLDTVLTIVPDLREAVEWAKQ